MPVLDQRQRPLGDLRISVTDRCNFRCNYCMPKAAFGSGFKFLPRAEILSFEEIARVARVFVELGVKKLRLTGGEPLLRAELPKLIAMLAPFGTDLALTTNGSLLTEQATALKAAGLQRVTVSLDSLDDAVFRAMNDVDFPVVKVLSGIEAAQRAGLGVKINCVVRRGINDAAPLELARHFRGTACELRFIEFMDVGMTNGWQLDQVVSGQEIIDQLSRDAALVPLAPRYPGEVARRFQYRDGSGEIGVITSVTEPFCGDCARARLSAEGKLYTCLFAAHGVDLRAPLRESPSSETSDAALTSLIRDVWSRRDDRYSEERSYSKQRDYSEQRIAGIEPSQLASAYHVPLHRLSAHSAQPQRVEMSYIGG